MNDDEKEIAALLQQAGPRPEPAEADIEAVTASAREVWRARYGRRRSPSWWWLAAAAAVVLAAGIVIWWPGDSGTVVARVEQVRGNVPATPLHEGHTIRTDGSTRIALRMAGGQSLVVREHTELRLESATLVELRRGAVYLDTGHLGAVDVRTAAGDVHPAGTRFEVRVDGSRVRVRVYEGRVSIGEMRAIAGEELSIVAMPEIEGRTLHDFASWLAREQGWQLRYATPELEARSRQTVLHGSVRGLVPEEALQTVMLSAGVRYTLEENVVRVTD